jgi:hypothetical protein
VGSRWTLRVIGDAPEKATASDCEKAMVCE